MNKKDLAKNLANTTNRLFANYQENNARLAMERGLTDAEFRCLRIIGNDKGLNNKEVANRMNLSQSRLTRIVDGLVKKGYITRQFNRIDSRSLNLTFSRKANLLVKKLDKINDDLHYKVLNGMNISQQKSLIIGMEKLYSESIKLQKKNK